MAIRFPLILNNVRFQVNPRNLRIRKPLIFGDLATQEGIQYQIWYNAPEMLTITGISAGESAYQELLFLKNSFESSTKISELFYKTKIYRGFMKSLEVGHTLDEHLRFPYTIEFQMLHGESFNIHDFALNPTGALSRASNFIQEKIGAPISNASRALNKALGKII